jgi:Leucine-rich repeat (LRR) protein
LNLAKNSLTSLGHLPALESLDVSGNRLGNDVPFPTSLTRLSIAETNRTQLPTLAELRHLDASFNAIESLQALEGTPLTRLSLRGGRLRPRHGDRWRLPALRRLDLSVNFIGDEVVNVIDPSRLARLQLMNSLFTDRGVAMLVDRRPDQLTHLDLSWNAIGDDSVPRLLSLPNLFELKVSGTRLSRRGVRRLREAIPIVVS